MKKGENLTLLYNLNECSLVTLVSLSLSTMSTGVTLNHFSTGYIEKRADSFAHQYKEDKNGCFTWMGAVRRCTLDNGQTYGVFKLTEKPLTAITVYAHVFAYFIKHQELPSRTPAIDISHICHHPRCVNVLHLSKEARQINQQRRQCKATRTCIGHGLHPNCIFFPPKK